MLPGFQLDLLLIYFVYGLAFFSMGLLMLMEAGRSPLLAEARTLRPLAAFGISHGLHEWLELFILQAEHLGAVLPEGLVLFRLALLVFSFLSLLAYGVQILRPATRLPAVDAWVGAGAFLLYLGSMFFVGHTQADFWVRIRTGDALARYFLAVPGGLLAAGALSYSSRRARQEQRRVLADALRWSAAGMAGYALLQIFVSPAPFYPASVVNDALVKTALGVPVQLLRTVVAVVVTVGLLRAIQVAEDERQRQLFEAQQARLEAMQRAQEAMEHRDRLRRHLLRRIVLAQEEERTRIAHELHDETAQILTASTLTLASLRAHLEDRPRELELADRLQDLARQMSVSLRRLVHDLRPAQLDDLGIWAALEYLADTARTRLGLDVTLRLEGERRRMLPLVETVIFRIAQEALTNAARHAHSKQVEVYLRIDPDDVYLRVQDRGSGFEVGKVLARSVGSGVAGMRERAEAVGAQFNIQARPGSGTIVEVSIPCSEQEMHDDFSRATDLAEPQENSL